MISVPYSQYPRTYQWLIRLLPLGMVLTLAAFTIGAWTLATSINDNSDATRRAQITNIRQEHTIRLLCDRGYIMLGLIEASISAAQTLLIKDLRTDPPRAQARVLFIRQFQSYRTEILAQLLDKDSPCVTG